MQKCGHYELPIESAGAGALAPKEAATDRGSAAGERQGVERVVTSIQAAVLQEGAYLVPLRLFIGLGWLRACAEKVADPGWQDGSTLTAFLHERVATDTVAFPPYTWLIENVFLPHAAALALVVLLGQLLAGAGILLGALTNAALLGGLFMNLNFLLAGEPNPSAFYIVIQAVLLLVNVGAVLGLDARLASRVRSPLLAAQPPGLRTLRLGHRPTLAAAVAALVVTAYALPHVTNWSPGGSVEDPAMILATLGGLGTAWLGIAALRVGRPDPRSGG
jgi:thiosulfate dehydrogenase [quinone] large subunit